MEGLVQVSRDQDHAPAAGDVPVFVVRTKDGSVYEIFANGATTGFGDVDFIYNGIAVMQIKHEAELSQLKSDHHPAVTERQALEMARHELTTLHGLLAADGMAPTETWTIDTSKSVAAIDAVLSESSGTDNPPS